MRKLAIALLLSLIFTSQVYSSEPSSSQIIPNSSFSPVSIEGYDNDFLVYNHTSSIPSTKRQQKPTIIKLNLIPNIQNAKVYALNVLGQYEFSCIDKLFERESHWNPLDRNSRSGAYGIPQAVPGSKMAIMGSDWRTNPITQVKWGIFYVNSRYGSACGAWEHSQIYGWY